MLGFHLTITFDALSRLGLVRSKRHFSRTYLGHGSHYLRDVEQRGRDHFRVPRQTVEYLRARLASLVPYLSAEPAAQVKRLIDEVDQQSEVADWLGLMPRRLKS